MRREHPQFIQSKKCSLFWGKSRESKRTSFRVFRSRKKEKRPFVYLSMGYWTRIGFLWRTDETSISIAVLELVQNPETYYFLREYFPTFQGWSIKVIGSHAVKIRSTEGVPPCLHIPPVSYSFLTISLRGQKVACVTRNQDYTSWGLLLQEGHLQLHLQPFKCFIKNHFFNQTIGLLTVMCPRLC